MTKADLIRAVYRAHGGLSRREAAWLVDRVFAIVKKRLLAGGRVQVSGFGCFEVVTRKARKGRNPQTGEIIAIEPRQSLVFRPSKVLVETMN